MALTKCINSESKQYKPVLVDKLILDDVPTVNSLNAITSDAVARAVAGASGEVPQVTENDNGKVLKAIYDAGGPAVEWGDAAPAVTVDQTYNALSENAQSGVAVAEAIAAIPSSSYTAGDGINISNQNVISATTRVTTPNAKYCFDLESEGVYPSKVRFLGFGLDPYNPIPMPSLTFDSVHATVSGNQFEIYIVYNLDGVPPTNLRKAGQLIINSGMPSGLAYSAGTVLCYPAKPDLYSTLYAPVQIPLTGGQLAEGTYDIPKFSVSVTSDAEQYTKFVVKLAGGGVPADVETLVSYFENNGSTAITVKLPDELEYLELSAPDQTYDATSTNAQSGVAVASAIAALGITSIQQVNALPASPDANTLYLIPET